METELSAMLLKDIFAKRNREGYKEKGTGATEDCVCVCVCVCVCE